MSYFTTDRDGVTELNPPEKTLREILRSLDEDRDDHAEVWLTHGETHWTLTVFTSGAVQLHNDMLDEPTREMLGVNFKKALELWLALARGDIAAVKRQPWSLLDE